MNFNDNVKVTYQWLKADKATKIMSIATSHGGTVKRLAQERGALGYCKVEANYKLHSWLASSNAAGAAKKEIIENGLSDSLTFGYYS